MNEDAKTALKQTALFGGLTEDYLDLLASLTEIVTLKKGEFVFHERDMGNQFYVILKGRVRISRQIPGMGEEALAILDTGNYFGEMALVEEQPRSADAIVHESATLLVLSKRNLEDLLFLNKDIAYEVLWAFVRTLSSRLRETSDKLTFLTVTSRFG